MEDRIRILPQIIANQIKAGEVVETPSSAVKEMMENSVDAGATRLTVNFVNGGRDIIQIVDNGCGMSPTDARTAFQCHATSKISTLDDIYALTTFGFRGEALASIAAISQMELLTRREEDEIGTRVIVNGGDIISQTPAACPVGAQFTVRNIFYNTPARRKFIDGRESGLQKAMRTEFRRVALCHPEVEMELMCNSVPIYSLPVSSTAERIVAVMGSAIKSNLLEVEVATSIADIKGYIGRPSHHSKGGEQFMFVNGRYFYSPYLAKAVQKAYEKLIPSDAKPSYFIYLTVDPKSVDVNVHAKKIEVKFSDEASLWQILHAAVKETLAKSGAAPLMDFDLEATVDIPVADPNRVYHEPKETTRSSYNPFSIAEPRSGSVRTDIGPNTAFESGNAANDFDYTPVLPDSDGDQEYIEIESTGVAAHALLEKSGETERLTVIGGKYAVGIRDGKFILADLRRCRERILFDSHMRNLEEGHSVSQALLFPETAELSDEDFRMLKRHADDFYSLGFDLQFLDSCTVEIDGIPAESVSDSAAKTLQELVTLIQDDTISAAHVRKERLAASLARAESSTKGSFSESEAQGILAQTYSSSDPWHSPSGLSAVRELGIEELKSILEYRR